MSNQDVADFVLLAESSRKSSSDAKSVLFGKYSTRYTLCILDTHACDYKIHKRSTDFRSPHINVSDPLTVKLA